MSETKAGENAASAYQGENSAEEKASDCNCEEQVNNRKAAIIGCGFVGSSIAFTLMQRARFSRKWC